MCFIMQSFEGATKDELPQEDENNLFDLLNMV